MLDQLLKPETKVQGLVSGRQAADRRNSAPYQGVWVQPRRDGPSDQGRGGGGGGGGGGFGLARRDGGAPRGPRQQAGGRNGDDRRSYPNRDEAPPPRSGFSPARQGGADRGHERSDAPRVRSSRNAPPNYSARGPETTPNSSNLDAEDGTGDSPDEPTNDRHGRPDTRPRKKSERGSLLHPSAPGSPDDARYPKKKAHATHAPIEPARDAGRRPRKLKQEEAVQREVFIPPTVRVGDLARIVDARLGG